MQRRQFTKTCISCLASASLLPLLDACKPTHYTSGTLQANGLSVSKSEFKYLKKDQEYFRPYIIVRNDAIEFPIYLYRFSDAEYSAVLMKCSHQGNELSASGDHLTCSAHGSEFNNTGAVTQGPAESPLRRFPVSTQGDKLFIDLSAQS